MDDALALRLQGALDAARSTIAQLHESLVAERSLRESLADALGACPDCCGWHLGCPRCHGRGRPGSRRPDPELFRLVVEPAVRAARKRESDGSNWLNQDSAPKDENK